VMWIWSSTFCFMLSLMLDLVADTQARIRCNDYSHGVIVIRDEA
jgi:hypothetical protein